MSRARLVRRFRQTRSNLSVYLDRASDYAMSLWIQ